MIVSFANNCAWEASDAAGDWCGFLLNQAAPRIRNATTVALAPLGITPPQLRALEAIDDAEPLTQVKLGEMVKMDRSTIVHVIDHFEKLGAASRKADPADRRSHAVMLTKKGRQILRDGQARARAVEDEFLSPLSQPERDALQDLLRKLLEPRPSHKGASQ